VFASDELYTWPNPASRNPVHGDISSEDSFTTTATDLSVHITWDNIPEHVAGITRYQILVSTVSGDYAGAGCYEVTLGTMGSAMLDGPTGYTIIALSTSTVVCHSAQLSNQLHPIITNELGMIWVEFSGTTTHNLDDVYDAIVSAGFSSYATWDGYNFAMKGWLYSNSSDAGMLWVTRKRLSFPRGGIKSMGAVYTFRFGSWLNDYAGAYPLDGCAIDTLTGRYGLAGLYSGRLQMYACLITTAAGYIRTNPETMDDGYYCRGSGNYITYNTEEIKECIMVNARANTSDVSDTKWGQGNNWSSVNHVRLKIWTSPNLFYGASYTAGFYDCDWNIFNGLFQIHGWGDDTWLNYTDMYDCRFPGYPGGMIDSPYVRYFLTTPATTSPSYIMNHYRVQFKVLDVNGNPVEGVSVSAIDGSGNSATWIEHDGTNDRIVTGTTYITNRTTDANGEIDYYLRSYKNYLNPTWSGSGYTTDTLKDDYYPYTINFSKNGWRSYSVLVETMTEPVIGVVTMEYGLRTYVEELITADIEEDKIYAKV
jgi:hypothetical protein